MKRPFPGVRYLGALLKRERMEMESVECTGNISAIQMDTIKTVVKFQVSQVSWSHGARL